MENIRLSVDFIRLKVHHNICKRKGMKSPGVKGGGKKMKRVKLPRKKPMYLRKKGNKKSDTMLKIAVASLIFTVIQTLITLIAFLYTLMK